MGACLSFRELAVAVRLKLSDFGLVVLGGRSVLHKVLESPVSVAAKRFGKNDPALGLGEDSGVFLGALIVYYGERSFKGVLLVGRVHEDKAKIGVQLLVNVFKRGVSLLGGSQAGNDGPALWVEPHVRFGIVSASDYFSALGESADKAVLVPAKLLDFFSKFLLGLVQEGDIFGILFVLGELAQNRHRVIVLERDKRRFAVGAKAQAVVPVGVEARGNSVGAKMLHRKIDGPLQVLVNRSFIFIGKGNHLVKEGDVSRFRDVFVDSREKPERVVGPVSGVACLANVRSVVGSVLVARVVGELDKRKSSAVVNLRRKHKANFFGGHLRLKVNDALNVLNSVAVSVSVPQAAVNVRGSARPSESHETVVSVPGVDHRVEVLVGSLDLEMLKTAVPLFDERLVLLGASRRQVSVARKNFFDRVVLLHRKDKGDFLCLSVGELDDS